MTYGSFQRVARSAAAGAFIFALSLTSLGSSAVASSAADKDEEQGCSALAHVRNEAMQDLRDAWRGFRKEVRDMAHDARDLRKESSDRAAFTALMTELRDANGQLDSIRKDAREQMQTTFAATVCTEQTAKTEKDGENDEDSTENQASQPSPEATALATGLHLIVVKATTDMQAVTVGLKATVAAALEAAKAAAKPATKAKDEDEDEDKDEEKGHDDHDKAKNEKADSDKGDNDKDEEHAKATSDAKKQLERAKVELKRTKGTETKHSGTDHGDGD